ncbi:PREDICTED: RING finger protein 112 isoform X1 [Hipposideros armiger]|uniref:RING finger protein 112 n=1 Tax=Hipposideros armiger TaxID=186990 RepID=A0A8B7QK25_HIPAR|nr:PREDICTED: RING finger protein 112 isoform X1 [Hipposideros armiger]
MPRSALSVISFCHWLGKQERKRSFMGNSSNSWSHMPFPKLELSLGSWPAAPQELPTCSICLEKLCEPVSLDCGHDFCTRCFSTHRVPGCERPCCPECCKICKQKKGFRGLGEKMKLLPQRPPPPVPQETCAVRAEPLLLVRINASGGLILRMGAINRCLKHPLARDTPVCLLAVLGEQHSGKTFLLNHLLQGLPGQESCEGGWLRGGGSLQGFSWDANSLSRGIWMWSHPFLLGKGGRKVAVFLVDTGDAMSPELSSETRTKLCALTTMLSSYQILNTSQELKDKDLEYLEMFLHVAEVMGRHHGIVPIQHLDLLVRDSSHSNKTGQGHVGDVIQESGKYPRVWELLHKRRARCYLLPAPRRRWASKDHGSPGNTDDDFHHLQAYIADVLSAAPQHAKSRCQGYCNEGRPLARGDRRLLTGQQLAQEIKVWKLPRNPGKPTVPLLSLTPPMMSLQNLSGWMGRTGPGFASPDQMATQLHNLRMVEAAKKEFEEYVRQQDMATKCIFSALRVLPNNMRNLLSAQKDAILAHHRVALLCHGREQTLDTLEAELQAEAKAFMDAYTMRFCGHLAAVGGAVGAGLMGLAGVVGAGMAAAALAAEAGMVAAGVVVGATGAAVVGGGVGAGLAATMGCMEKEEDERVQGGDREPLLQEE